jgi:chemotaxis protein methyltransferase CheR
MEDKKPILPDDEEKINQNIEISSILETIYCKYGYDFRNYSKAHLKRRILGRFVKEGFANLSEMQHMLLKNADFFHTLLVDLSLNVTEMFRDPIFFYSVRENVIPMLKTYPFLKIWHAGCSTGEEVYSMAILLKEENLLDKCLIYATDFNQIVLDKAAQAIYPINKIKEYTDNYNKTNAKASFSDYFTVKYDAALLENNLKKNIIFSDHNLVTDGVFGEMNMIVCRNVLIYFNHNLQNRVFKLFYESLLAGGILCLGTKETMIFSEYNGKFKQISNQNIYKKIFI